jgi:hypothetical protein
MTKSRATEMEGKSFNIDEDTPTLSAISEK